MEHTRGFRKLVKWRTGREGRISYLKRGYGWDRTRLDRTVPSAVIANAQLNAEQLAPGMAPQSLFEIFDLSLLTGGPYWI